MAALHGTVDRYQSVVLYHDEPPNGYGKCKPDRYVMYDNAEVGMEPHVSSPSPRVLH